MPGGKKMPVSKAQARAAFAAAKGGGESGMPEEVAQEFVKGIHGKSMKGLPDKVRGRVRKQRRAKGGM